MASSLVNASNSGRADVRRPSPLVRKIAGRLNFWIRGISVLRDWRIYAEFLSPRYQRHNVARLQHLDSLGLELRGKRVLEIGAGVGDHTVFYLYRNCRVVSVEGRAALAEYLSGRLGIEVLHIDVDREPERLTALGRFDLVHCYGLLYHLSNPERFISCVSGAAACLVLETCVSFAPGIGVNRCRESRWVPSQALHGVGCRPTREWIFGTLKSYYKYVYATRTQPHHPEFPVDWTAPEPSSSTLLRAVFVASHNPVSNPNLVAELPCKQNPW